jgi:hypothetical protein
MAEDIKESLLSTFNLAKIASDAGLMRTILHMHDVGKMGCVPAIVAEYDYATKIAKVLPLVKFLKSTTGGLKGFDRPFYKVPVYSISQGGFRIDLPLFAGNTGMLFAVDREWETAKSDNSSHLVEEEDPKNGDKNKNKGSKDPDSLALADFQFGFFLPMTFGGGSNDNKGKIVLSRITDSEDSSSKTPEIRVEVGDEGVVAQFNDDKITFNEKGLTYEGKNGEDISLVTNIRYDISSHQVQKRTRPAKKFGNFIVGLGEETNWTMIEGGQAVPESEGE